VRGLPAGEPLRDVAAVPPLTPKGQLREHPPVSSGLPLGHVVEEPQAHQLGVKRNHPIESHEVQGLPRLPAIARRNALGRDLDAWHSVNLLHVGRLQSDALGAGALVPRRLGAVAPLPRPRRGRGHRAEGLALAVGERDRRARTRRLRGRGSLRATSSWSSAGTRVTGYACAPTRGSTFWPSSGRRDSRGSSAREAGHVAWCCGSVGSDAPGHTMGTPRAGGPRRCASAQARASSTE